MNDFMQASLILLEAVMIGICVSVGLVGFGVYVLLINGSLPI